MRTYVDLLTRPITSGNFSRDCKNKRITSRGISFFRPIIAPICCEREEHSVGVRIGIDADAVAGALTPIYQGIEVERQVHIPDHVRSFMESLIVESMNDRIEEWQEKRFIDLSEYNGFNQSLEASSLVVNDLLRSVDPVETEGQSTILLISIIQRIHLDWCGVFPFCR